LLKSNHKAPFQQVGEHLLVVLRFRSQPHCLAEIVKFGPPQLVANLIDREFLHSEDQDLGRREGRWYSDDTVPMAQLAAHRRAQLGGANRASDIHAAALHTGDGRTINEADVCFGANPERLSGQMP